MIEKSTFYLGFVVSFDEIYCCANKKAFPKGEGESNIVYIINPSFFLVLDSVLRA